MPHCPPAFFDDEHGSPDRQSRGYVVAAILLIFYLAAGTSAHAQTPQGPTFAQSTGQSATNDSAAPSSAASGDPEDLRNNRELGSALGAQTGSALSSDQIVTILEQNPDLVLELKTQLADLMGRQGVQVDPMDISDQMLYDQIATNSRLRANITMMLHARGFITDNDLQLAGPGATSEAGSNELADSQLSMLTADGLPGNGLEPGLLAEQRRQERIRVER